MKKATALGIECVGSSHSFCVALADDGDVLAATRSNRRINLYEQGVHAVAQHIYHIATSTLGMTNRPDTTDDFFERGGRLCAGITGVTTAHDRNEVMRDVWEHLDFPQDQCIATGDAEVLLSGGTGGLTGLVLVWHAGSVAYARNGPHNQVRVGGWGPLIGDEGSGYYIGRNAVHALTWHRDGYRCRCPELATCIRQRLDESTSEWGQVWRDLGAPKAGPGAESDAWIDYLVPYSKELTSRGLYRYALSDLVKAVAKARAAECAGGDSGVATLIIDKSVKHIVDRLLLAVARVDLTNTSFPVVLAGGVAVYNQSLREALKERIGQQCPGADVQSVSVDATYHTGAGAALHALSGDLSQLPSLDVCESLILLCPSAIGGGIPDRFEEYVNTNK